MGLKILQEKHRQKQSKLLASVIIGLQDIPRKKYPKKFYATLKHLLVPNRLGRNPNAQITPQTQLSRPDRNPPKKKQKHKNHYKKKK
jgi:hypothetical protein